MAIKHYRPTTPGRRHASVIDTSHLDKKRPERSLISIIKQKAGRNNSGKISVRHRGGGAKRFYRQLDFKRDKYDSPATVTALEYDPNRTSHIALLTYADGEKRYILAPQGLKKGDQVTSSKTGPVEIQPGNTMPLSAMPIGLALHNIELTPGQGGSLARSAGTAAVLQAIEGRYAQIKLPS